MFSQLLARTTRRAVATTTSTPKRFTSSFFPQPIVPTPKSPRGYHTPKLSLTKPATHTQFQQQTRRHFSTTQQPVPQQPVPVVPEAATAAATTESTTAASPSVAAYEGAKAKAPLELLEVKKKEIKKRMMYFRIFTILWIPTYIYFAKHYYTDQISLFQSLPAIQAEAKKQGIQFAYEDAHESKWSTPSQSLYRGKNDLQDRESVQRLLLRNIMIGQRIDALLVAMKANLMTLSKNAETAKYKQRCGNENFYLKLLDSVNDVESKVCLNGVTTLMAFNYNMKEDDNLLNLLNPLKIASRKDLDVAIRDAFTYPILGKLALRRANAGLLFINSIMDDEWWANNADKISNINDFEKIFAYWEAEQGFKRHQFERFSNGGANIIQSIAPDAVKNDVDQFLNQAKNGQPVTLNSLTMTPLEERTLHLPDPSQVIDMSKFPDKSVWGKVDLTTVEINGAQVPRSGWYYIPLPTLPTKRGSE